MKATLIMYSAKGLNKTEASKLSKKLIGYLDKSNKASYTYEREGMVTSTKNIIVAKSVFIVPKNKSEEIIKEIRACRAKVVSWNIEIPRKYFKN